MFLQIELVKRFPSVTPKARKRLLDKLVQEGGITRTYNRFKGNRVEFEDKDEAVLMETFTAYVSGQKPKEPESAPGEETAQEYEKTIEVKGEPSKEEEKVEEPREEKKEEKEAPLPGAQRVRRIYARQGPLQPKKDESVEKGEEAGPGMPTWALVTLSFVGVGLVLLFFLAWRKRRKRAQPVPEGTGQGESNPTATQADERIQAFLEGRL